MSWWVKEHLAVNDDETKQLCSIEADNQTSLPAADQTATAGFIIVRGSSALVLDTGDRYIMNSGGTWIQQPSGVQLDLSGYATTQDLTDGLAGKVDTSTYNAGQAAQDTVIAGKASVSSFALTLSTTITASEYSYSCITTGDINTVCFRITLATGLNANTSYTLFALPSGTYPRVTVAGTGYANSKLCVFWINSGGQIRFTVGADAIPSGATINANFCYSYKAANWTTVTP